MGHSEEWDTSFLSRGRKCPREKSQWRENAARSVDRETSARTISHYLFYLETGFPSFSLAHRREGERGIGAWPSGRPTCATVWEAYTNDYVADTCHFSGELHQPILQLGASYGLSSLTELPPRYFSSYNCAEQQQATKILIMI